MSAVVNSTGGDFRLEIDSGADRSIINMREAKRLGLKLRAFKHPKPVVGVGNEKINCTSYVIICMRLTDVDENPLILNVLCYVFDTNTPNLLGSDIMKYIKAQIDFKEENLVVGGRKFKLSTNQQVKRVKGPSKNNFRVVCD